MKIRHLFLSVIGLISITQTAVSAEVSWSGFGTVGYAQSDQSYKYQRFIDKKGGFMRDSVIGAQADVTFNPEWGATVQAKVAPSVKSDSQWDPTITWAFLAWRPSNDLLIRMGKQRVPLYLYSESLDVGVTYDFAHLPVEMYSIAPTTDYIGGSFSKTWNPSIGELTLDGYAGSTSAYWRIWQRDKLPGSQHTQGANFLATTLESKGMVLTLLRDEDKYRASIHDATLVADPSWTFTLYNSLVSGRGFGLPAGTTSGTAYTVLPQATAERVSARVLTFSAEINLPKNFRVIGEVNHRILPDSAAANGTDSSGGYLALLKDINEWTPYVSYARVKSNSGVIALYQSLNSNPGLTALVPVPAVVSGVVAVNASQRVLADYRSVADQSTIAFGASYRLTATQKIKFEWARTHVGTVSIFVDAPAGGDVRNQDINVLSLSYSSAF